MDKTLKTIEFDKVLEILSNFAISDLGKKRCQNTRLLDNIEEIRTAQKITTQAQNAYRISASSLPMGNIPDITNPLSILKNKITLSIEDVKDVFEIIVTTRKFSSFLHRYAENEDELIKIANNLYALPDIEEKVENIFDTNFNIKESASPELKALFQSKRSTEENIKTAVSDLMKNTSFNSYLQDSVYTLRDNRIVFQVKAESKNKVQGIVHDISQSGQTYFIEPKQIVGLNNKLRELEIEIEAEIHRIIKEISSDMAQYHEEIKTSFNTLIELDFIFAKARYSTATDACEPEVIEQPILDIKSMKNPVLLSILEKVIENDFFIGNPYKSIIITGSNAGGKTVALKTVALFIAMTRAGLHLPCFSAKVYPFKKLFAEIGDDQNIIQSLSTFSSHIKNIKNILDNADSDTFILIDEIAAGTDPKEGASLARAVMEKFVEKGAFSLISTHFNELKSLPFNNEAFQNASVDFDSETLMPTYKLRIGVPGSSNAFAIARNFGIEQNIINNAENYYSSQITEESKILGSLQEKYTELNRLTQEAQELKTKSEEKYKEYNELFEQLNSQKRKTIKDFKRRHEDNLQEAKAQIKKVLENLNHNKTKENAIKSYKKLSQKGAKAAQNYANELEEVDVKYTELTNEDIKIGAKAIIKGLDQDVTIETLPDKNGNLQVLVGQLKTNVNIKKLAKNLKRQKDIIKKKINLKTSRFIAERVSMSPKLDLRGFRIDEALSELDSYLDKASMVNLSPLEIIHGHGTGQLRQAVRSYLSDSPYVAKFRQGEDSEGGNGVTIVDIN
ncbi:MAG: endonuclease MutS2 [Clostridium sp.]|nr:endonuclease MutS2 [Clostridium sp.]